MRTDRRSLLKILPIVTLAGAVPMTVLIRSEAAQASGLLFVADERLADGQMLAAVARREGHKLANPNGEIVAHFLGQGADWLKQDRAIIGVTSYTDMMLMRDLSRMANRPLRYAAALDGRVSPLIDQLDGAQARAVEALRAPTPQPGRASAFLWMV